MADVVIDTHVVIWYFADPGQLSKRAENAIDQAEITALFLFLQLLSLSLFT